MERTVCLKATVEVLLRLSPDRKQMAALVNGVPVRIEDLEVLAASATGGGSGLRLKVRLSLANGEQLTVVTWRPVEEASLWPLTLGVTVGRVDWALRGVLAAEATDAQEEDAEINRAYDWTEFEVEVKG